MVTKVYCDACGCNLAHSTQCVHHFEDQYFDFCPTCSQVAHELRAGMLKSFVEDVQELRKAGVEGTPAMSLRQMEAEG